LQLGLKKKSGIFKKKGKRPFLNFGIEWLLFFGHFLRTVLQVLRKMIATRFEKKSRFSKKKRGKLPSFNFGIEWLFFFWSFSKDSTSGFKENDCN